MLTQFSYRFLLSSQDINLVAISRKFRLSSEMLCTDPNEISKMLTTSHNSSVSEDKFLHSFHIFIFFLIDGYLEHWSSSRWVIPPLDLENHRHFCYCRCLLSSSYLQNFDSFCSIYMQTHSLTRKDITQSHIPQPYFKEGTTMQSLLHSIYIHASSCTIFSQSLCKPVTAPCTVP